MEDSVSSIVNSILLAFHSSLNWACLVLFKTIAANQHNYSKKQNILHLQNEAPVV